MNAVPSVEIWDIVLRSEGDRNIDQPGIVECDAKLPTFFSTAFQRLCGAMGKFDWFFLQGTLVFPIG